MRPPHPTTPIFVRAISASFFSGTERLPIARQNTSGGRCTCRIPLFDGEKQQKSPVQALRSLQYDLASN